MSRPVCDVNVTPFIDVLLVLLILFMVMVPVRPRGLDASLPKIAPSAVPPGPVPEALVVVVTPDEVTLNRQPVASLADLEIHLRAALGPRRERTVFVRGDGALTYGRVVAAMDAARGAGAERIGILAPQS